MLRDRFDFQPLLRRHRVLYEGVLYHVTATTSATLTIINSKQTQQKSLIYKLVSIIEAGIFFINIQYPGNGLIIANSSRIVRESARNIPETAAQFN